MACRRIPLLLCSALLALAASAVGAAELGEPRVTSYRGQALVADIELTGLDDPASALPVRLAHPDVYRGASVTMAPVLSALNFSVMRRDGRQFVHVTSSRPVEAEMLLLFLELGQGAQKDVRLATLFLAADPRPAPPPPAPAPVLPPVQAPVPVPVPVASAPREEAHAAAPPLSPPLPLHLAPVHTALPAALRAAPPGLCKPSAANSACAILDKKNVALQAKLSGLEEKIKLLQTTLAPAAEPAPAAARAVAPAIAPAPPKPVAVLVKPKKPKPVAHPPSATPWVWIGVTASVALAALGALVFLLLRRRRGKVAPALPKPPGFIAGVKSRLMARKTPKAPKVEPLPEQA